MAALPDSPLVSVEEYLSTAYDPDVEYVDGVLVERNVGDWLHSLIQSNVLFALRRKYPHLKAVPELRSSVTDTRYRLPDVCVLLEAPKTKKRAVLAGLLGVSRDVIYQRRLRLKQTFQQELHSA